MRSGPEPSYVTTIACFHDNPLCKPSIVPRTHNSLVVTNICILPSFAFFLPSTARSPAIGERFDFAHRDLLQERDDVMSYSFRRLFSSSFSPSLSYLSNPFYFQPKILCLVHYGWEKKNVMGKRKNNHVVYFNFTQEWSEGNCMDRDILSYGSRRDYNEEGKIIFYKRYNSGILWHEK